ncbi:hypothetical protein [Cognatishimia sp.]|uniref:hypothetical protein n=1 Tax=Cognatishimia sp. TaxID=2211648 RepID=UPI003515901E|nr:hypothetical protein [Cognatishimia sp.]
MKALAIIQGINEENRYLDKDLTDLYKNYQKVVYINTEKYFDSVKRNLPWYLRFIPNKYKDYAADIWGYFTNRYVFDIVNTECNSQIGKLLNQGYEVDVFAHSLGTVITLCLGKKIEKLRLNTFFCIASPMGFFLKSVRLYIKYKLWRNSGNIFFEDIVNIYGENDLISKRMDKNGTNILLKRTKKLITHTHPHGHSHKHSLKFLL